MRLPDYPKKGGRVEDTIRQLIDFCRSSRITGVSNGTFRTNSSGTTIQCKPGGAGGTSVASPGVCHFGTTVPMTTGGFTEGIRGGIVYCGDKNFNVEPKGIDLETDGVWLVSLQLACESNRSDDNEIFLPGIATSSETDPATFWDLKAWSAGPPATQYDDNTNPEVIDGIGTVVIPLGKLTVADGAATFENTDCGHIRVGQCAGILSHERL